MRIKLEFGEKGKEYLIPLPYNHFLQAALFASLKPVLAEFIHDKGFEIDGRKYKMITFSKLLGDAKYTQNKLLQFRSPINWYISTPIDEVCESLASHLFYTGSLRIGKTTIPINNVTTEKVIVKNSDIVVKTLSPVVAYSTMTRVSGNRYTCYFSPGQKDFEKVISENATRKLKAFLEMSYRPEWIPNWNKSDVATLSPIRINLIGKPRKVITQYKGIIIEAYDGCFAISGDNVLLQTIMETGMGSKNTQGFGCLELIEN